jgi:hypothetical protein
MGDVYLTTLSWLKMNGSEMIKAGITHIVLEGKYVNQTIKDRF